MADEARMNELLDLYEQATTEGNAEVAAKAKAAYYAERDATTPTLTVNTETPAVSPPPKSRGMVGEYLHKEVNDKKEGLLGVADIAATLATGGVGAVAGGLLGGAAGAATESMDTAGKVFDQTSDALTWSPKTKAGQDFFAAFGKVADPVVNKIRDVLEVVGMHNPTASTLLETTVLGIPQVMTGGKMGWAKWKGRGAPDPNTLLKRLEDGAKRLGIDLNNNTVRDSTVAAAERLTGGSSRSTSGLAETAQQVKDAATASRKVVDARYTAFRDTIASMQDGPIKAVAQKTFDEARSMGLDLEQNPRFNARLEALRKIDERIPGLTGEDAVRPGTAAAKAPGPAILGPDGKPFPTPPKTTAPVQIPLNEVEIINAGIRSDIKAVGAKTPEGLALIKMRKNLNAMIDEQFVNDMVTGDPAARQRWIDARGASREHAQRFKDDKVIAALVEKDLNSTEVANLILGMSETKHKAAAIKTVTRLKEILGPDPAKLEGVRTAVYADLFDPIMKEPPNFKALGERLRKVQKDDGALLHSIGISADDLDLMRRAAQAAQKAVLKEDVDYKGFASMVIARQVAGHDIAKAGLRVRIVNMIGDRLLGAGQKTHQQLLQEFARDVDMDSPVVGRNHPSAKKILANAALIDQLNAGGTDPTEW